MTPWENLNRIKNMFVLPLDHPNVEQVELSTMTPWENQTLPRFTAYKPQLQLAI